MTSAAVAELDGLVDAARAARSRLRGRPLAATIASLAAAARRWRDDAELRAALPDTACSSPEMVAAVVPLAADAIAEGAMTSLVEDEWGAGAARRPAPRGPAVVAHVVASNVPALAVPAIALGCLSGAAVVVKSGRDDPLSAPAFVRALAAVDADLAATVVATYWRGGDVPREDAVLARADVVVATGGDVALAALAPRLGARLVAHGPRISVALAADDDADAVALDVALHDQRGCLSPHAVYVVGAEADAARFADRLAAALDALAERLPPGPAPVGARAAARVHAAEAEWASGARVVAGRGGCVIHERVAPLRATHGRRTIRVHAISDASGLAALLPSGAVECVGVAGVDAAPLVDALRDHGVSRVCPLGRMQRPSLAWPRGQLPPLGALLGRRAPRELQVEE